jgi:putative flippase GtrA
MRNRALLEKMVRFGLVGLTVMAFFMGLNWLLARWLGADGAFLAAYVPALTLHFLLNKWWTFGDRRNHSRRQIGEYLAMVAVTFLIQMTVFKLVTHLTAWPSWLAAGAANAAQMAITFLVMQRRIFAPERDAKGTTDAVPLRRGGERMLFAILMAAVVAFYVWTTLSTTSYAWKIGGERQSDYFNLLTDGFLDGHLYLKTEVPPALLTAENPYDPEKRPPGLALLHDASYYHGHYYLYFGVAPVVTLFLPFTLLTGADLPPHYGNAIFAAAGFCAAAGLFLALRRRYFPSAGTGLGAAGVLALGLGSMLHAVLRRPSFWELPIAAAYFFGTMTLVCVYRALHARRSAGWMLAAGLGLGLAVGSRPTYIVATPLLAMPLVLWWWQGRVAGRWRIRPDREWGRRALLAALGLGVVVFGILWHNYARFGNPAEFGLNYQLNAGYEAKVTHFTPRFVPFNAFVYYLAPAQWSPYFPFVEPIRPPKEPDGYYGIEFVYGVLCCLPLTWFAVAAPLGLRGRAAAERGPLAAMLGSVAFLYLSLGGIMLFFVTAAARYMVDFTPTLMLLGCCGMLAVERWELPRWGRRCACGLAGTLAAISVFFGTMASFQLHDLLRINDPAAHRHLAHFFDYPSAWFDQWTGTRHGPLELKVRFPARRPPERQLLVSTGWAFYSDHVFAYYPAPGLVQLGFVHGGEKARMTEPFAVDFETEHTLRIEAGSLYPPPAHPFFDGRTPLDVQAHSQWLRLVFDGRIVLQGLQAFFDASPGSIRLGGAGVTDPGYGLPFQGQLTSVRRGAYAWLGDPRAGQGPLELTVFFPPDSLRRNQPLVVAGRTGRADLLYVRTEKPGTLRFGYDHWGYGGGESPPVACDPSQTHLIEVRFGSLLPSARTPAEEALRASLVVRMDGAVVWSRRMPYYDTVGNDLAVARNEIGASSCETAFGGAVLGLKRLTASAGVMPFGAGRLPLQLMLPTGHSDHSEPLVATGTAGNGDLLLVRYVDESHVRFGYDHGGVTRWQREPVAVDYGRVQELDVQWPALIAPATGQDEARGELVLVLNGAEIWRENVEFHRATATSLTIGENGIGTKSCEAAFSGGVVRIGDDRGP